MQRACEEFLPFDAVVAENGAVVYFCGLGRKIQIGSPPPDRFLGELRAQSVPFYTAAHGALESINWLSAGLLMTDPRAKSWQVFDPAERITRHAHHARKYTDTRLSEDKAFRFVNAGNGVTVGFVAPPS